MPIPAVRISLICLALAICPLAYGNVLTFDDLPLPFYGGDPIPNGYGGLSWSNMYYVDWTLNRDLENSGYEHGAVSGLQVALNGDGTRASASGSAFDLYSAYLTAAWNDELNVTVMGFRKGAPVYSETVVVDTTAPTLFQFNYFGIDELVFDPFGGTPNPNLGFEGTHFVMDNVVIAVPEPSPMTLGGVGVLLLAAIVANQRPSGRLT